MKSLCLTILASIFSLALHAQIISTFAGNTSSIGSSTADGVPATATYFVHPQAVACDNMGNVYISDNNRVRKVTAAGIISTFAGNGFSGDSGDGGSATAAGMDTPNDIATDPEGNVYIVYDNVVRKITPGGIISNFAGTPSASPAYGGDGFPATAALLYTPQSVATDAAGNVYIGENSHIRKVNTAGIISTIAGNVSSASAPTGDGGPATDAHVNAPYGIVVDAVGNIFFSDYNYHTVRKINTAGIITTIAGTVSSPAYSGDGGPATAAMLNSPRGMGIDAAGNIYIAEFGNQCIRKISTTGIITTAAGLPTVFGYSGDGGPATTAHLHQPFDVAFDGNGSMFIDDWGNYVIRKVQAAILSGPTALCTLPSATLTASTLTASFPGGTWTSSNALVASIGSASGNVTVNAVGTATITYTLPAGVVFSTITVQNPPAAISGPSLFCAGAPVALSDTGTGSWTSNSTSIATIGAGTGVVTGVSAGTDIITYNATASGCATIMTITVDALDPVISLTGSNTLSVGAYTTYQWFLNGVLIPGATSATYTFTTTGIYTVHVTDGLGCSGTSGDYTAAVTTGVTDFKPDSDVQIYPNPVSAILHVKTHDKVNVIISSSIGQVVKESGNVAEIDLRDIADGVYIIKIYDENNTVLKVEKLIKTAR